MSKEAMKLQKIMEQAQVFASAWSLVGGRFDGGNAMDDAEVAKNELRQMVEEALAKQEQKRPQNCGTSYCSCIECVMDEQERVEPVGEAYLCDCCLTPFDGAYECPSCGHNTSTKEPVYTTPQQRTWVGLNWSDLPDEWVGKPAFMEGAKWAESKLKEKNT